MISIIGEMCKIKRSESFDKLDKLKRGKTLEAKSIKTLYRKTTDSDYKTNLYGKSKATEYIQKLKNQLKLMDVTMSNEMDEVHSSLQNIKSRKYSKLQTQYKRLLTKNPEQHEEIKESWKEDQAKLENELESMEKFEVDALKEKYLIKKQKTQEIIDQNSLGSSHSKEGEEDDK